MFDEKTTNFEDTKFAILGFAALAACLGLGYALGKKRIDINLYGLMN